jgi:hypothetical protein
VVLQPRLLADEVEVLLRQGDRLAPFQVKDCTGPAAGKTLCYYCRYGQRPVAAVFVREWSDEAEELIAQIDRETERRRDQRLSAFVISLNDDTQAAEEQLKAIASKHQLTRTPLTIYRESLAKIESSFGLSPSTKLAVLTWRNGEIQSVRAFDDARLSGDELQQAISDVKSLVHESPPAILERE